MELAVPSTDAGEVVVLELPVRDPSFDLEKAVCSHGLFMMAPNHWDPASRTLQRPLRLSSSSGAAATVRVRISHPSISGPILVSVAGAASFTSDEEQSLLAQVRRMMRISDENDRLIEEFHKVHADCRESGFGRIFRSPTLFEDMVKCILLCNCQWPRTLSMARALCELKLEVKHSSSPEGFHPNTPQPREKKRKHKERNKVSKKLETEFVENIAELSDIQDSEFNRNCQPLDACNSSNSSHRVNHEVRDFPTPEELAALDPVFLANRCKLGYRAERIASLARGIVNGKLQLKHLEEPYDGFSASSYDLLDEKLSSFSGFGPFTRANVLMCMGFYQRVPVDSETIRHIRLFHRKGCTLKSAQKDIEAIYGKYAPFQFLAYWSEIWRYYEERFGKLSQMPASCYPLITASNMKNKISKVLRVKKLEPGENENDSMTQSIRW